MSCGSLLVAQLCCNSEWSRSMAVHCPCTTLHNKGHMYALLPEFVASSQQQQVSDGLSNVLPFSVSTQHLPHFQLWQPSAGEYFHYSRSSTKRERKVNVNNFTLLPMHEDQVDSPFASMHFISTSTTNRKFPSLTVLEQLENGHQKEMWNGYRTGLITHSKTNPVTKVVE